MYERIQKSQLENYTCLKLRISNLNSIEDYKLITKELIQHPGIKGVGPYKKNNLITIMYYPHQTSTNTIIYLVTKHGFKLTTYNNNRPKVDITRKGG